MARRASESRRVYWRGVISRQKTSKQSIAEFCRDEGISPASFYSWRRRLRSESTPHFVPLPIAASVPEACFKVRLPGGVEVVVPAGFDSSSLERLLETVLRAERGDA